MEFEQDSTLTLPLFLFDDTLSDRDLEQPDFEISLPLDDELLTLNKHLFLHKWI